MECGQRFPGRTVRAADDVAMLRCCLASVERGEVLLLAPWDMITTEASRALAEWSLAGDERGCGVWPLDGRPSPSPWNADPVPEVIALGSTGHWRLTIEGQLNDREDVLVDRVCRGAPLLGLALTGHGDEECVGVGRHWIGSEAARLPGTTHSPAGIRAAVVFLNTCGTFRLADAATPRGGLLVEQLSRSGAAVIGAFRNTSVLPDLPARFGDDLLNGRSLGTITVRLNRRLIEAGREPPSFMLLGDPAHRWSWTARRPIAIEPLDDDAATVRLAERLGWLLDLDDTLGRWGLRETLRESRNRLSEAAALMFPLADAALRAALPASARATVLAEVGAVASAHEATVLSALAAEVQQGRWIQTRYATVSRRLRHHDETCHRCGARVVHYVFEPWGNGPHIVWCKECDRCGTIGDGIGEPVVASSIHAAWNGPALGVSVPRLQDRETGLVVVHRASTTTPRAWPREGGELAISAEDLPMRGRVTIAGLRLSHCRLCLEYTSVFVQAPIPPEVR